MGESATSDGGDFSGFVDQVTTYPLVEVVARCDAWKLKFRGSRVAAMLGEALGFENNPYFWSFSALLIPKLREMLFPQTSPIVGGQNSSSNLFLGSEPHVQALTW